MVRLLGVFDQQPADEVLGQLAGAAEVLFIEVVVHRRDVCQSLLLGLPQERGRPTQTARGQSRGSRRMGADTPPLVCHLGVARAIWEWGPQ